MILQVPLMFTTLRGSILLKYVKVESGWMVKRKSGFPFAVQSQMPKLTVSAVESGLRNETLAVKQSSAEIRVILFIICVFGRRIYDDNTKA